MLEVTLDHPDGLRSVEQVAAALADRAVVGAGTVMDVASVYSVRDAGGRFCICPHLDEEVVAAANDAGILPVPGALTPSEIVRATSLGAPFVKLFPAVAVGVDSSGATPAATECADHPHRGGDRRRRTRLAPGWSPGRRGTGQRTRQRVRRPNGTRRARAQGRTRNTPGKKLRPVIIDAHVHVFPAHSQTVSARCGRAGPARPGGARRSFAADDGRGRRGRCCTWCLLGRRTTTCLSACAGILAVSSASVSPI